MEIKLDREKRVILLKALNQGSIDSYILNQWIDHAADTMTIEEVEAEITRLERLDYPAIVNGGKKRGFA